jgi:DnaJ family protein C protein 11
LRHRKLKQIREENAERLQQRKEQAQEAIELMTESANRKHSIEFSKEGLVIVEALYGKLPPSNFDAVQPLSSRGMRNMADNLSRQLSSPFLGTPPAQLETESTGEYIDVTIPIKNLVSNSQIYIAGGHSKSSLLGFYDPCFGESKRLRITYKFHGRVHMVEVDDRAPVAAPLRAHVV